MESFLRNFFYGITALVMALTLGMVWVRAKVRPQGTWPLAYYAVLLGFALGFKYSLNLWVVAAGVAAALVVRFARRPRPAQVAEYGVLAYVFTRGVGLILGW